MKIRSDFVSNSSSSSFVVACSSKLLDKILKDIAKSCIDIRSEYHDSSLAKRNLRILDYCINTYQLLFLGTLVVDTKCNSLTLSTIEKLYPSAYYDKDSYPKIFNDHKRKIREANDAQKKDPNDRTEHENWLIREYGKDTYDADLDEISHFEEVVAENVAVSNDVMSNTLQRWHFEYKHNDKDIENRVKNIIEISKFYDESHYYEEAYHRPYVFSITKDTIANTRELIETGHKLYFDKWEDLDMFEKKLDAGEKIFVVRVNRDGDGYGDTSIYDETSVGCLSKVSGIEIIACLD